MRVLLLVALATVSQLPSRTAEACTQPVCSRGTFVPGNNTTVPVNVSHFYWYASYDNQQATAGDPNLVRLVPAGSSGASIPLTVTQLSNRAYLLQPSQPLTEGVTYVLEDGNTTICDGQGTPSSTFTTGPSAPLPTTLGDVAIIGHGIRQDITLGTVSGSCSVQVDAVTLSIEVDPSSDAAPWMAMLHFETVVDGDRWSASRSLNEPYTPGASWEGRGRDLLFRVCTPHPDDQHHDGLAAGGHQVVMRASYPGTQVAIETPAQPFELFCDPSEDDGDGTDGDGDGDSAGCSSTRSSGSNSWLALLGVALLTGRRARRSSSR